MFNRLHAIVVDNLFEIVQEIDGDGADKHSHEQLWDRPDRFRERQSQLSTHFRHSLELHPSHEDGDDPRRNLG